ncbi:MAG TPA: nuclear transport factor 2 family protein [Pyrinomonadaceae bacterium]|jgi:beta-aspartyl-peptidase (threonine type)
MKAIILFVLCAGIFAPAVSAQQSNAAKPNKREQQLMSEIRAVMDAQVAAWNRGDIEGFMRGYAQSPDTIFVSGDTVTRGWQTVLDRYKKGYDSREKMGQLTFSELEIMPVGKDAAVVLGRWQLQRAGDTPHGRFTLIFRRTRAGWRIVHDHTSSA